MLIHNIYMNGELAFKIIKGKGVYGNDSAAKSVD